MSDAGHARAVDDAFGTRLACAAPFAPLGPDARLFPVWTTPLLQGAAYILSAAIALAGVMLVVLALQASGGDGLDALTLLLAALALQFPLWALLIFVWIRRFERRSFASIGLVWEGALGRYAKGLAAGVAIAVGMGVVTSLFLPDAVLETGLADVDPANVSLDPARFLTAPWIFALAGVAALFLVQSACEEIAFRGWMMSAVAGRWRLLPAVIFNSAVFGVLHFHLLAAGLVDGMLGIAALATVGLFLSLWALAEGSIAGVCGVHGAFNTTLVVVGALGAAAMDPTAGPGEALLSTIEASTSVEGEGAAAGAILQLAIFALLSAATWPFVRHRLRDDRVSAAPKLGPKHGPEDGSREGGSLDD